MNSARHEIKWASLALKERVGFHQVQVRFFLTRFRKCLDLSEMTFIGSTSCRLGL